jgi:hypothetical protein
MKIEELNSMSYREIEKLAKEKLNITRRGRVSKVSIDISLFTSSVKLRVFFF